MFAYAPHKLVGWRLLPGGWTICCLIAAVCWVPSAARAATPGFRNEVMAVLSNSGCNQGTCHGNQNGKNGFRLSLRGQDPDFDFASLTRDMLGRRLDNLHPAESLVLLKATGAIPHEGGQRFHLDSEEYAILSGWIAAGAPADPLATPSVVKIVVTPAERVLLEPEDQVRIQVQASFSDGTSRDVTRLAVFETTNQLVRVDAAGVAHRLGFGETNVMVRYLERQATVQLALVPAQPQFQWRPPAETNFIDHHVFAKLQRLRINPTSICNDAVFQRRAYLDAIGLLPTVEETRAFSADVRADKRTRLIDSLLARPEFSDFWALKWSDVLRNDEKVLDSKGVRVYHQWIRQSIADGMPLNEFARAILSGRGSSYAQPSANFYRALREPRLRSETVAQVFLGIRVQCARCHNHPFDAWTQDDYHALSAFFARVQYKIVENRRPDKLDTHEFSGEQIVWQDRSSEVLHPKTGEVLKPRFLGSPTPEFANDADRLQALADWVARRDNPFFARTQVNRVWFHLLGRGIVDADDDFRASNPPANAPLLDALVSDFVRHDFDLRYLVRTIMNSSTYQLDARPNDSNRDDEANFSHARIHPLQAEQLLDAYAQVTGVPVKFDGYPLGIRAGQLPALSTGRGRSPIPATADQFLKQFGKPERLLACDCERTDDATLGQAFQLISGDLMNRLLSERKNRIGALLDSGRADPAIVEDCYLAALCRLPTPKESQAAITFIAKNPDRRAALEDFLWGLLNAKEFLLRR